MNKVKDVTNLRLILTTYNKIKQNALRKGFVIDIWWNSVYGLSGIIYFDLLSGINA